MAGKVLLGLLAAAAVTGSAVLYSGGSSHTCPLSAGSCDGTTAVAATCPSLSESDEPACPACAAKSRAKVACCADAEESLAAGGDAMAAATGGVCLGR